MNTENKKLTPERQTELINILKSRFEKNMNRHARAEWSIIEAKLKANIEKLWSINEMEITGGDPDVIVIDEKMEEYLFFDCSEESPIGRRSYCYDKDAWEKRKEAKPENNVVDVASAMGISLLTETEYRELQKYGNFDLKTSSWIKAPEDIRKLGGALFCERRYNCVFVFHNGAQSYYAARGFRGLAKV